MKDQQLPAKPIDPEKLLTAAELAVKLKQHVRTIRAWAREGKIPVALRQGQNYMRFDLDEVVLKLSEHNRS